MKKSKLILVVLILSFSNLFGQEGLYLRFECGPTGDIYQYTDNGNELGTRPVYNGVWGLSAGKEFTSLFAIETGFYWNYYAESFYFKNIKSATEASSVYDAWQIPLRLKGGIHIYRDMLVFGTTVGLNYCVNPNYDFQNSGMEKSIREKDTIYYSFTPKGFDIKSFLLLETGLFLDMKLVKGFHLCLTGSYFSGFKKLFENNITYRLNTGPSYNAGTTTNGDYFNVLFGLKYVFQNKH